MTAHVQIPNQNIPQQSDTLAEPNVIKSIADENNFLYIDSQNQIHFDPQYTRESDYKMNKIKSVNKNLNIFYTDSFGFIPSKNANNELFLKINKKNDNNNENNDPITVNNNAKSNSNKLNNPLVKANYHSSTENNRKDSQKSLQISIREIWKYWNKRLNLIPSFLQFIFCELGFFCVYILTQYAEINSVLACGATVLMVDSIISDYGYVYISGALGSIMNFHALNNPGFLALSGLFSFIIFILVRKILLNIGGKPGTIAFLGNLVTFLLVYLISLGKSFNYQPMKYIINLEYFKSLNIYCFIFGPCFSSVATLSVHLLSIRVKDLISIRNRLISYGIVTAYGSLILLTFKLPFRHMPDKTEISYGEMYINYWHIGSLGGLSFENVYRNNSRYSIVNYLLAGYIGGWIGVGFMGVMLFGGKHGACALIGNVIYIYLIKFAFVKKKQKIRDSPIDQPIELIVEKIFLKNNEDDQSNNSNKTKASNKKEPSPECEDFSKENNMKYNNNFHNNKLDIELDDKN